MENLASNLKEKLTGTSFDANSEQTAATINPGVLHQFRKIQIPLAKIGLGSTEGDLVQMAKKYLEIVGLVLFVWIFGRKTLVLQAIECFDNMFFVFRLFSFQRLLDFVSCFHLLVSATSANTIQGKT